MIVTAIEIREIIIDAKNDGIAANVSSSSKFEEQR
jgi:hypothetical protein